MKSMIGIKCFQRSYVGYRTMKYRVTAYHGDQQKRPND